MTRDQQVLFLAVSLLAAGSANAATIVSSGASVTNLPNNTSTTVSFPTITNANELVSISGGSITSPEGANFTLSVNYVGGATAQIDFIHLGFNGTLNFNSLSNLAFAPGDINGLTFLVSWANPVGAGTIPANTTFTFNTVGGAVPEPASWALMLTGFGVIGYSFRRRRRLIKALAS